MDWGEKCLHGGSVRFLIVGNHHSIELQIYGRASCADTDRVRAWQRMIIEAMLVTAIAPAPPIAPGPGRVVMATMSMTADEVIELTVRDDANDESSTIPTPDHPLLLVGMEQVQAEEPTSILRSGTRKEISRMREISTGGPLK